MKRILVGYDGSAGSEKALEKALNLVEEGGEVVLLAVVPSKKEKRFVDEHAYDDIESKARQMIEKKIRQIGERNFRVKGIVKEGDAADVIIKMAIDLDCDLIILGKKGETEIRPNLLGSVAEKVITFSHKPVMVVR